MPKNTDQQTPKGNGSEQSLFTDVHDHYMIAKEDLETRTQRKNGFDDADKLFASFIDKTNWPYRSVLFDARPWTVIIEKSARLLGSKPKGRLVPREGGDALGAFINNELLSYEWDNNARLGESMIAKWIQMDQNARKYGSAFGIAKWRYDCKVNRKTGKKEVIYDGPDFIPCNPRDVLANPSYNTIKNWFQYREYSTLDELTKVNDASRTAPVYKNLDILKSAMLEEAKAKGDNRSAEYQIKNKTIRGLTDYLGQDKSFPVIEIITEYRQDRWITFAPRYGVILRDIANPYDHGEIPVIHLKYYPLIDDLYGVSEFEPVAKTIRAINAHWSAYSDTIALALRPPLMVNPTAVRMHTIEFTPEAKWLMNNPGVDVQSFTMNTNVTNNFQAIYSVLVSSLLNAWGEASQGTSNIDPFASDKTATEVRDSSFTRNVRDNMNLVFLSEALKQQILLWHSMNQQFMFSGQAEKVHIIRIVGKDAVDFFQKQGLSDIQPTKEDIMGMMDNPNAIIPTGPRYPVMMNGEPKPKLQMDETGQGGYLAVEPGDLLGTYDYIPDIESMKAPSTQQVEQKLTGILTTLSNPNIQKMLADEGMRPKVAELLVKMFESTNVIKDADNYFEKIPQQPVVEPMTSPNAPQGASRPMGATPIAQPMPPQMPNLAQPMGAQ